MKKPGAILVLILIFQLIWSPVDPLTLAQTVTESATSTESGTEETSSETTTSTSTDPSGGDGSTGGDITEDPPVEEPETSLVSCDFFQASPNSIIVGESSTLSWDSTGAISAVIDQGVGVVPVSGSLAVNPTITTSYTLSLTDGTETTSCSTTVYVGEDPTDSTDPGDTTDPGGSTDPTTDPGTGTSELAELNLFIAVINDDGGTLTETDFNLLLDGEPVIVPLDESGYQLQLSPGTYIVGEDSDNQYTASFSGDCDSAGLVTLATGDVKSCTVTFDDTSSIPVGPIEDDPSYNQPPVVYWVDEPGFEDGVHPNEVQAGETVTAKLIYYDAEGDFPDVDLWARGTARSLKTDEQATEEYLRDGDYANGEQLKYSREYTYSDIYEYYFTVSDYYNDEYRVPEEPAQFVVYDSVENYIPDDGSLIIRDNATGGDCELIGTWDNVNKVCTLTGDFVGKIFIAADDITLNGAGYSLSSHNTCSESSGGIYPLISSNRTSGITIQNFNFRQCDSYAIRAEYSSNWDIRDNDFSTVDGDATTASGAYLYSSNELYQNKNHRIFGNTFDLPNGAAVFLQNAANTAVTDNTVITANQAISLEPARDNVVVHGNIIEFSERAIRVTGASAGEISFNTIEDGLNVGISLGNISNLTINNNVLSATNQNANVNIQITNGFNNFIRDNGITNADGGLSVEGDQNVIERNTVENVQGTSLFANGNNNEVRNNSILDNEQYGIRVSGNDASVVSNYIGPGQGGIYSSGLRMSIEGNEVVGTQGSGVELSQITGGSVRGNAIQENNGAGIRLDRSDEVVVQGNDISSNQRGIVFESASDNTFSGNSISNNASYGLYASDQTNQSSGNVFQYNNFVNNGAAPFLHVSFDDAVAGVTLGTESGGNYWSQYDSAVEGCADANNDGFCDEPYEIGSNYPGEVVDLRPYTIADGWLEGGGDSTDPSETLLAPEVPFALPLSAVGPSLQWTDRSNNEAGFRVWRQFDGGSFALLASVPPDTTEYQDVYVGVEEQCYYVEAYTNSGLSAESDTVCTPVPSSSTELAPPEPISASFLPTIDTIVTSWRQPADKTGITGYEIYRSVSGDLYELVRTNSVPNYLDEALTQDSEHCYIARSYGNAGVHSPFSDPQCDTPYGIGSQIEVIDGPLNVRVVPDGGILGTQAIGASGTITLGPVSLGGYIWWEVDFANSPDGWVAADFIEPAIDTDETNGGGSGDNGGTDEPTEPEPEIEGCPDPEADNYEEEATIEDGSCIYPDSLPELTFAGLGTEFQDGVHPNKGYADETERTFKVVYKDTDGDAPDFVQVLVGSQKTFQAPVNTISTNNLFETTDAIYKYSQSVDESPQRYMKTRGSLIGRTLDVNDGLLSFAGGLQEGDSLEIELLSGAIGEVDLELVVPASNESVVDRRTVVNVEAFSADDTKVWSGNIVIEANDSDVNLADVIHTETIESVKGVKTIKYEVVRTSDKGIYIGDITTKPLLLDLLPFEPNNPTEDDHKNGVTYLYKTDLPFGDHEFYFVTKNKDMNVPTRIPFGDENLVQSGFDNVAFIPGIKGSRLYLGDDQLWLPESRFSGDASELFLDSDGTSEEDQIYTQDIIEKAVYFKDIYGAFAERLNSYQDTDLFDWKAIPYDWRLSYDKIIEDGALVGDKIYYSDDSRSAISSSYMLDSIEQMRNTSRTGNVKLIAHSMGGLISKRLLARLEARDTVLEDYHGLEDSVSELILVGSPQVGTPQAVPALLHGYDESLGIINVKGIKFDDSILTREQARNVGINAPSAYGLLPSPAYFEHVKYYYEGSPEPFTPAVTSFYGVKFENFSPDAYEIYNRYQQEFAEGYETDYNYADIDTASELASYLTGSTIQRGERPEKLDLPFVANDYLLAQAWGLHGDEFSNLEIAIDYWEPDQNSNTEVIQIAGYGNDTVAGYYYKYNCGKFSLLPNLCELSNGIDIIPRFTTDGDKVVVTPSAAYMEKAQTYYVDFEQKDVGEHADMMGAQPVLALLEHYLLNKAFLLENEMPENATTTPPRGDRLYLSVHSPVTIGAYDSQGNFTGLKRNTETGQLESFEEIPDSSYFVAGEGKYLSLPPGQEYQVEMVGTDEGRFMFISEEVKSGQVVESNFVENIPVATTTVAILSISPEKVGVIEVDVDGNGERDYLVPAFESFNDVQVPTTQIDVLGQKVSEKTYLSPVKISFSSEDVNGVGVRNTEYSIDGETWQEYTSTTTLSEEGKYTIYYRSTDWFGNVEETKSVSFEIVSARGLIEETAAWAKENGPKQLQRMLLTIQDDKYWEDRNTLGKKGGKSVLSRLENAIKFIGESSEHYKARLELADQILEPAD